ncbi:MAG: hypothetical protein U1E50_08225 [Caulobacteraceae bacterium]
MKIPDSSNEQAFRTFERPNGVFMFFAAFDREGDFPRFLEFVKGALSATVRPETLSPYSRVASIDLAGGSVTVSCDDNSGCFIRVAPKDRALAAAIEAAFSQQGHGEGPTVG